MKKDERSPRDNWDVAFTFFLIVMLLLLFMRACISCVQNQIEQSKTVNHVIQSTGSVPHHN
jgi:hypothetical protein